MNSMLCSRCKKRMAVVFVTRMEGEKTFNEGLCLQCAKELGIKPVEDLMNKMGISGDELDAISEQMMNFDEEGEPNFEMGGAQAFPFLNSIFGGDMMPQGEVPASDGEMPIHTAPRPCASASNSRFSTAALKSILKYSGAIPSWRKHGTNTTDAPAAHPAYGDAAANC